MIIKLIISLFTGGITKFADTYRDIKIAKVHADTETNQVVKDLELRRLKNEAAASAQAFQIRMATKDHWEVRVAVGMIFISTAFHYACTVLDNVYHFGWNIKPLPKPMDEWQGAIILSFIGVGAAKQGISTIAAIMLKRKG